MWKKFKLKVNILSCHGKFIETPTVNHPGCKKEELIKCC